MGKNTVPPEGKKTAATAAPRKAGGATSSRRAQPKDFPIVGIGASAGGLEALEQFFSHVPKDCGMAFVVIQHLDPDHKGMMPELLQRITPMTVTQARPRMKVMPNCVYVIPPNKDLSILHGTLSLLDPVAQRGLRLPIDFFFRTLADDRGDQSIGVILSGMGSDGTLGLRAIKEKVGLVLVQEPASAKFDAMPRSAIDAGLADIIATPAELPGKIIEYVRHASRRMSLVSAQEHLPHKSALDKIFILLRAHTGHDFSLYKKSTVYRRIERRRGLHQIERIDHYVKYLRENPQELELLFKELLIGVTNFFRDPEAWAYLQEHVLPQTLKSQPNGRVMRAWVIGCSTGEEAYSLAIVFREALERLRETNKGMRKQVTLQIFATDLDQDAIDKARSGRYPANIAADVSPERLARFFVEEDGGYRVRKSIREMVVFAPQNVVMDPPFTKLDILTCRNLLIYLDMELQKKLLPLFHYCLNPEGVLFLGSAESIGNYTELFSPLEAKARLYRRGKAAMKGVVVDFPSRFFPVEAQDIEVTMATPPVGNNLQLLADQLLLRRFSPPAVMVNSEGDILYINGRTGKYLEPAAGKANWNIHVMAREELRHDLTLGLLRALRSGECIVRRGIQYGTENGQQVVDLTIEGIKEPEALRGMAMIVFSDVEAPAQSQTPAEAAAQVPQLLEMEQALQEARTEIRITREEMQTSQEELKSTNEELQSTNEELQSTNEELTTSKEEMQSLNEELQMVNAELQAKVDELSWINDDMRNLLDSTDIATIFLDRAFHIRRFTRQVTKLFKLIPGDVGRPLSDIATALDYPNFQQDIQEVLRSLVFSDKPVPTTDGRWFQVKIMPYRTQEDVIDGVVITLNDISASKRLEEELRRSPAAVQTSDTDTS